MKIITITTQNELDALPNSFDEYTRIEVRSTEIIVISRAWNNSSVVARENSSVEARGNSSVEAWGNSSVVAWENSSVVAWENSHVVAQGNSSVEAWGNSSVMAWNNSSVVAWNNSSVEAWNNSSVVARGNSSVVARGNSSVVARENSSVEARGNSSVEAWENSSVVAREKSSVEANDFSMIAILGTYVLVKKLLDYSVASFRGMKANIELKHETAIIIETPTEIIYDKQRFFDRCESFCEESVILYKSVNPVSLCDFQTGKIKYDGIVECPDWKDDERFKAIFHYHKLTFQQVWEKVHSDFSENLKNEKNKTSRVGRLTSVGKIIEESNIVGGLA